MEALVGNVQDPVKPGSLSARTLSPDRFYIGDDSPTINTIMQSNNQGRENSSLPDHHASNRMQVHLPEKAVPLESRSDNRPLQVQKGSLGAWLCEKQPFLRFENMSSGLAWDFPPTKAEKREMQWRVEQRELEWKAELRQMEWQIDWQSAKLVEESELLRPLDPMQSDRRSRSNSRVREHLINAVAAAQNDATGGAASDAAVVGSRNCRRALQRPSSAGGGAVGSRRYRNSWDEAEDAIERLVDHAVPGFCARHGLGLGAHSQSAKPWRTKQTATVPSSSQTRSARRPRSAIPTSRKSLAEEVAADLDGVPATDGSLSTAESAGDEGDSAAFSRGRTGQEVQSKKARSSSSGLTYKQVASHSTKWFDLQRAKQRAHKTGGFTPANAAVPTMATLDEVCLAYPQVSQILAAGSR